MIIPFISLSGFRMGNLNVKSCVIVETCYALFAPDKLFEDIAEQVNLYASQQLELGKMLHLLGWTILT